MKAIDKYNARADKAKTLVCVGLDPDIDKLTEKFKSAQKPQFEFNKWIIDQTAPYTAAFKFNSALYESRGDHGIRELKSSLEYIKGKYPKIFTICDAKRGEITPFSGYYAKSIFEWFGFDAVTLNPYLGHDALQPFLDYRDKGCIILARTSNPGAREIQDQMVNGKPLWQIVSRIVARDWNKNKNCMLVVGATYPKEMEIIRETTGDMIFLVPGVGAQGGDIVKTVKAGLNSKGGGLIINSGRAIIYAENPAAAAKQLRDDINRIRKNQGFLQ